MMLLMKMLTAADADADDDGDGDDAESSGGVATLVVTDARLTIMTA